MIAETRYITQEVISISLTPNEAYSLYLSIERAKNKVAQAVNDKLYSYIKSKGLLK